MLGVDYGEKRVGLAISDPEGIVGLPLETVAEDNAEAAAERIAAICRERAVGRIVLGLPRNMNGTLGAKAEEAAAFGELLAGETGLEVIAWDERLSTVRAERSLRESQMSRKKRQRRVDAVAAQVILQSYLDAQKRRCGGENREN